MNNKKWRGLWLPHDTSSMHWNYYGILIYAAIIYIHVWYRVFYAVAFGFYASYTSTSKKIFKGKHLRISITVLYQYLVCILSYVSFGNFSMCRDVRWSRTHSDLCMALEVVAQHWGYVTVQTRFVTWDRPSDHKAISERSPIMKICIVKNKDREKTSVYAPFILNLDFLLLSVYQKELRSSKIITSFAI